MREIERQMREKKKTQPFTMKKTLPRRERKKRERLLDAVVWVKEKEGGKSIWI
jgi:hypothetical protein